MSVAIVDLGVGNCRSVANMVSSVGLDADLVREGCDTSRWRHIVLPGVGSFDAASKQLDARGWREPLLEFASNGVGRLIGICLGAQLLGRSSEEGVLSGLNVLPFSNRRFAADSDFRVPRMEWSQLSLDSDAPEWLKSASEGRYYFSHSYFMDAPRNLVYARTLEDAIPAIVGSGQILGVQFHPEKSHKYGRGFLEAVLS